MALYVLQMTPPPVTSVFKTNDGYAVIDLTDITTEKSADSDEKSAKSKVLDREWKERFLNAYEQKLQEKHRIIFSEKASDNPYLLAMLGRGTEQGNSGDDEDQWVDD
jgi:parvulin-like peptidyl-prolyl isomerase